MTAEKTEGKVEEKVGSDSLLPLAYAAAATTSSSRSLTTGEVRDDDSRSSSVSRNFRVVDWVMKMSEELRSIMAHSW